MKRFLIGLGIVLLAVVLFFFWASTGRLAEDELAQLRDYPAAPASAAPDTVTVTTYNIGYLSGMTNNQPVVRSDSLFATNMNQAIGLIQEADPDVIGFQEIDYGGARVANVHQLDTIATRLDYATAAQAVNWDERYLPFPYGRPAVNFGRTISGQAVLSRYPIRQHVRTVLSRPPQPFFRDAFYLDRLAQTAAIDLGGRPLAVINLHLEAFHTGTREKQARQVRALYDTLAAHDVPTLVLGDLNSELSVERDVGSRSGNRADTDSETMLVADETMRILLDGTPLRPTFPDSTYRTETPPATYPADAPDRKIDYVLYPSDLLAPVDRQIQCGTPSPPSDHCAVTASFRLRTSTTDWPAPTDIPSLNTLLAD